MQQAQLLLANGRKYINAIDELLVVKPMSKCWEESIEEVAWNKNVVEMMLRIKLLYAEFDNGKYFLEECYAIDAKSTLIDNYETKIRQYKKYLQLFTEHINEYRLVRTISAMN
jgi:hypothetical protein